MAPWEARVNRTTTQDDVREQLQLESFGLRPYGKGRSNKYVPDATLDGFDVRIELKSSDVTKGKISTCREFGLKKLEQYRQVVFIFSQYQKSKTGVKLLKHVFCTPDQLEPFFEKVESNIRKPSPRSIFGGLDEWDTAKAYLECSGFTGDIKRLANTFERGTRQNDPRLKWADAEAWGTVIDNDRLQDHLRELLEDFTKEQ
jgi:hypothetical protein